MNTAIEQLSTAWRTRQPLVELPAEGPANVADGYAYQDALLAALATDAGQPVGYKVGCTNAAAQQLLGMDGPFYGRLLQQRVFGTPARLAADTFSMRVVEPEFAFKMGRDLPASGRAEPFSVDEVADAIATVLPAIEIVDSRYANWTTVGGPWLITDNGANGAFVPGPDYAGDWRQLDLPKHGMDLYLNDERIRQGQGELVLGNPLNALLWLANTLREQGKSLRAGDIISTGVCCEIYKASAGDRLRADFGGLGVVELEFT